MIMIRTLLKSSDVHGIGIFADEPISKGQLIWQYNALIDSTFTPSQWEELKTSLSRPAWERLSRYFYFRGEDRVILCDGSQFMNHSDNDQNVGSLDGDYDKVMALRDIAVGEELMCNYSDL